MTQTKTKPVGFVYKGAKASYYRLTYGFYNTTPDAASGYPRLSAIMKLKGENAVDIFKACEGLPESER